MIDPPLTPEQKTAILSLITAQSLDGEANASVVANTLNRPTTVAGQAYRRRVPIMQIELLGYRLGLMSGIIAALDDANPQKKLVARTVNKFLESDDITDVDMDASEFASMLTNLKAVGLITSQHETAFLALADATMPATEGPSPFAAAFPTLEYKVDGSRYQAFCHPDLVTEARS